MLSWMYTGSLLDLFVVYLDDGNDGNFYILAGNRSPVAHVTNYSQSRTDSWVARRKQVLSLHKPKKVIISAYMRGGSSIVGQIFNQDERAIYWYQPLGPFYMANFGQLYSSMPWNIQYEKNLLDRISMSEHEQATLADYFSAMFECDYQSLPNMAWMHPFLFFSRSPAINSLANCVLPDSRKAIIYACPQLKHVCDTMSEAQRLHCFELIAKTLTIMEKGMKDKMTIENRLRAYVESHQEIPREMLEHLPLFAEHHLCLEALRKRHRSCLESAALQCPAAQIQAAKVTRLNLEYLPPLLDAHPDLHVIHVVRDPRAIAASRLASRGLMIDYDARDVMLEVGFLCRKLRDDVKQRRQLEVDFPGAIFQVRYEDLVVDPVGVATDMYHFIGRDLSRSWLKYAKEAFNGNADSKYMKSNATGNIEKWREHFSQEQLVTVENFCSDVVLDLGYPTL